MAAEVATELVREQPETRREVNELDLIPQMVCDPSTMKARLDELQRFVKEVMVEGVDYGPPFPGSDKKVLLKPGAEKLAEIYGYAIEPRIVNRVEHWGPPHGPFFSYEVECIARSKRTGLLIGKGVGSCNTRENRYRWRTAGRKCPKCGKEETIIKGKREYGGGWLCFGKKGGCGEKFANDDPQITNQEVGRIENDDICTLANTVLKISKKRAYLDVVISVTQSSGLFTGEDDDDDLAAPENGHGRGKRQQSAGSRQTGRAAEAKSGGNGHGNRTHLVKIRGKEYHTAGIEADTLIGVWNILKEYNEANPDIPDAGKAKLRELTGKGNSLDLNDPDGKDLIETVRAILSGEHPADQPGDANEDGAPY